MGTNETTETTPARAARKGTESAARRLVARLGRADLTDGVAKESQTVLITLLSCRFMGAILRAHGAHCSSQERGGEGPLTHSAAITCAQACIKEHALPSRAEIGENWRADRDLLYRVYSRPVR